MNSLKRNISSEFSSKIKEKKLLFLVPEELISFLNGIKANSAKIESTVLGYMVEVSYATSTKEETNIREEAISIVILSV